MSAEDQKRGEQLWLEEERSGRWRPLIECWKKSSWPERVGFVAFLALALSAWIGGA